VATEYEYDVFISYRRDQFRDAWLNESFIPLFTQLLQEDIAEVCQRITRGIFFDQTALPDHKRQLRGLEPGDDWQEALRAAIKSSRCVVCLWSPLYFFSEWCQLEWTSFRQRGLSTQHTLVVPMSVHDGNSFPPGAKAMQAPDFSDYVVVGEGFRKTEAYVQFQKNLKQFSQKVAKCVNNAPAFADFPMAAPSAIPPTAPAHTVGATPVPAAVAALNLGPDVPQQRL